MRNSRRIIGGFILALAMSTMLSADAGAPGGASRGTCGFLQGIVYKIGNADAAARVAAIFDSLFGCDI